MSDFCKCWRTEWQYDMMADDKGVCKHCGNKIAFFFTRDRVA